MKQKMTKAEFGSKCEREGGWAAGFEYGLSEENLNDDDPQFKKLIKEAREAYDKFFSIISHIENEYGFLEEWESDDD